MVMKEQKEQKEKKEKKEQRGIRRGRGEELDARKGKSGRREAKIDAQAPAMQGKLLTKLCNAPNVGTKAKETSLTFEGQRKR